MDRFGLGDRKCWANASDSRVASIPRVEVLQRQDLHPQRHEGVSQKVYEQMPRVRLTDLLVEVASWTGFTQHFTHLKTGEPAKDLEPILAAILADGTNLGLSKMAGASADS